MRATGTRWMSCSESQVTEDRRADDPRADGLRRRFHQAFVVDALPVPVEAIASDLLGLWVEDVDDLPVSGALIPSERRILLNRRESLESPERRRFTLAHEIGHWVCQCDEGRAPGPAIMCRAADIAVPEGKALEREANAFAATLLMPQGPVRDAFRSAAPGGDARFGVSALALAWRLFNLGLTQTPPTDTAP